MSDKPDEIDDVLTKYENDLSNAHNYFTDYEAIEIATNEAKQQLLKLKKKWETEVKDQYFSDMVDIQLMVCDIKNDYDTKLDNIAGLVNKRVKELTNGDK